MNGATKETVARAIGINPADVVEPAELMTMTRGALRGMPHRADRDRVIKYAKSYMLVYFDALGKAVPGEYKAELDRMGVYGCAA